MFMPRSFQHGVVASPPATAEAYYEKDSRRKNSYTSIISARIPATPSSTAPRAMTKRPDVHSRAATEPVAVSSKRQTAPVMIQTKKEVKHRPDALSPSVAALLAMTAIPPPRPHQTRRRRTTGTPHMSIDELVSSWKNDSSLKPSLASSPSMSILLEDVDLDETSRSCIEIPSFGRTRSTSTDSIPSLDADDQSSLSVRSPSTPASLRSHRSFTNLSKRFKSSSVGEECLSDHPLLLPDPIENELIEAFTQSRETPIAKTRSSFRSNLTTSLQALKNAAISTFKSPLRQDPSNGSRISDDVLWSHPFLFPRLTTEMRPTIQGTPSQAQRRYLNPMPLTFEEQEAPYQQALHAPFLAEKVKEAPLIQLQTYARGRRRINKSRTKSPDPQSEAGRALQGIRQREPRENADFLRVVVLEMNMRRAGKLESGRAKIWLPPRQSSERNEVLSGTVPARWIGICA